MIEATITDRNGLPLRVGDRVYVHQDDVVRMATVTGISGLIPTICKPGYWVDIDIDDTEYAGKEGMMSYVLERRL